jgi:glycosyltransferase involved in cell wall biosynthesis
MNISMPNEALISVIVSTYNRPDALNLVLNALAQQTDRAFELLVADDGSTAATGDLVARFSEKNRDVLQVVHVWQPDNGFRLSAIRNKAIMAARGDYLIFIDGDCVPQRDLIARHRALAHAGVMVTGSRILLDQSFTEKVLSNDMDLTAQSTLFWLQQRMTKRINKMMPLFLKLPASLSARMKNTFSWKGIKGCNMAAWRADIHTVGGFDEAFTGWGHEDADFVARLSNAGIKRKLGFCATEVLHLWHREQPRSNANPNYERVLARLRSGEIRPEQGLPV